MVYKHLGAYEFPAMFLCGSCVIGRHEQYDDALKCLEDNNRQVIPPKTTYDADMHKILMGYIKNLANNDEQGNVMSNTTEQDLDYLERVLHESIGDAIDSVDITNGLDAQTMKSVSMALCDKLSTAIANWEKEIAEAMAANVTTPVGNITKPQKTLPQAWKEMGMCVQCGSEGEQRGMSWHCQEHGYMYGI